MPKFRILCSTTTLYWLDIEAPSRKAARLYYETCDGSEFNKGQEDGWALDEIDEDPDISNVNVTVDAQGKEVKNA